MTVQDPGSLPFRVLRATVTASSSSGRLHDAGGLPEVPGVPRDAGHHAGNPVVRQYDRKDLVSQRAAGQQRPGRVGGCCQVGRQDRDRHLVQAQFRPPGGGNPGEQAGDHDAGEGAGRRRQTAAGITPGRGPQERERRPTPAPGLWSLSGHCTAG